MLYIYICKKGFPNGWGYPKSSKIIQVMNDYDLVLKPMVTWESHHLELTWPGGSRCAWCAALSPGAGQDLSAAQRMRKMLMFGYQ